MTADRYTKIVLTIIAVCQCLIVLRDMPVIKPALAQSPVHVIVDEVNRYAFRYNSYPMPVDCRSGCK